MLDKNRKRGDEMEQSWRAWNEQFNSNFGSRELLRFLGVFAGWQLLGLILSLITGQVLVFYPFLISAFLFPIACRYWTPAYELLRFIAGNKNLPSGPVPRRR